MSIRKLRIDKSTMHLEIHTATQTKNDYFAFDVIIIKHQQFYNVILLSNGLWKVHVCDMVQTEPHYGFSKNDPKVSLKVDPKIVQNCIPASFLRSRKNTKFRKRFFSRFYCFRDARDVENLQFSLQIQSFSRCDPFSKIIPFFTKLRQKWSLRRPLKPLKISKNWFLLRLKTMYFFATILNMLFPRILFKTTLNEVGIRTGWGHFPTFLSTLVSTTSRLQKNTFFDKKISQNPHNWPQNH